MSATYGAFDASSAQDYLASFDPKTRREGEKLFESGCVVRLSGDGTGQTFEAVVDDRRPRQVTLAYDPDMGWGGYCDCVGVEDCAHAYAALKAVLAGASLAAVRALSAGQRSASARDTRRAAPGQRLAPPEPPLSEFGQEIARQLGRRLLAAERAFLQALHRAYERVRAGSGFSRWDFEQLGLGLGGHGWEAIQVWPRVPTSEREFWEYVALAAVNHGRTLPAFLADLTDLTEARERMARWQRQRTIQQWSQSLAQHAQTSSLDTAAPRAPIELRVVLRPSDATIECRRPGQTAFEPLKISQWQSLDESYRYGRLDFTPPSERLWQTFQARIALGRSLPMHYSDFEVPETLSRLLRAPELETHVVNAAGQPFQRAPEPLRWQLAAAATDQDDYRLELRQADGQPLPPLLCTLPGHPAFYVTEDKVFTGPPPVNSLLDPRQANLVPAPALDTSAGVAFLQQLGLEPPPRIRDRIETIPLRVAIRCEVRPIYPNSPTENCLVHVRAEAADGSRLERWTSQGWAVETPKRKTAAQASAEPGAIRVYERSLLAQVPAWLDPLGLKLDPYSGHLAVRISKKFPELFVPWLRSLPPEIEVRLEGDLASFAADAVSGRVRLDATETEIDWFDLRVVLDVSDTTLTPAEIKLLLNAKGRYVRLKEKGWRRLQFDLSPEEDAQLARLGLNPHDLTAEPQRLHALQLADQAARRFLPEPQVESIERRASELKARVTPPLPEGVTATLRPYQLDGFHFLAYLAANRFGGILADDMGLGKTLQALAWILWLRQGAPAQPSPQTAEGGAGTSLPIAPRPAGDCRPDPGPTLVICPKSVMDNWRAEAERFTPSLRVEVWAAAELPDFLARTADADLHVLNYSQLRLLGEGLATVHWLAVILDEGQYIKNPSSQTTQVARALRATHRLVLSGTPIENRLLDLWSLLTFAMPGVLSSRHHFTRVYNAKDDPLARRRLAARVRPFLLRRTKSQVARDLPDRTEEDLFCEIEGEQLALYRAELKHAQQLLLKVNTQQELARDQFHFLTSLLRLRQICCHPRLVKPDSSAESAKVLALVDHLEPLMEEGHKVLVFSQFVELLGLLKPVLKARDWPLFYLAGDTENRGELVRTFQETAGAGAFLISLKAGGFGLNLTAASYVVLFDPWWNPAVENQAIDRTHRIGQTQPVIAYRLLIKHSIEEKIRLLQKQKSALAEDVLGEERFSQSLTLEDLRYLFASD